MLNRKSNNAKLIMETWRRFINEGEETKGGSRDLPEPPNPEIIVDTLDIDIDRATQISDEALNKAYRYGLSKPGSFGYEANKYSSMYALDAIMKNFETVVSNPEDRDLITKVADAVHDGWSYAAYNVDDPRYETQPQKKINRFALADTLYSDLDDEEKEKDRVIARALINTVYAERKDKLQRSL